MAAPLHVRLQPILRKVDGDEAVNTWIEELSLRKAYSLDTTQKVLLNQAFRILELKSKSEFTSNSIDSIDEAIWNYLGALPMRFWITEALEGVTAEMYALKQVSYKLRSWMAVEVPVDFTGRLHPLTEWIVDPKPNAYGHYAPDSVFEPILSQIKAIIDPMSTPAGLKDGLFALKVIQTRLGTFYIERGYSHWKRVGNPILLPSAYNGAGAIVYAEDLTSKHSEMLRQIAPGCMTDTPGPFAECCDAWQELSSQIHETLQITGDGHALQTLLEAFDQRNNIYGLTAVLVGMQHFDTTPHRYRELFGNDRTGLHCLPLLSRRSNLAAGRKLKLEMWTGTIRFFEYEDAAREVAAKEEATAKQGAAAKEEAAKRDPVREQKYPNLRSLKKTISQVFKPTRTEGHEGHGASE